ncbi:MAG: prepilin peptidase [Rhodospirillales bacterium]|jgi:leader peptidase (prepilin peptidase)/N-methyltransferase|nr:prepilin peptidase [Rhodospirillales bacterium]
MASPALSALVLSPFAGSFLANLAVRLPAGEGVVRGRSRCRSCGATLGVTDLVPIVGWLLLGGRCRHCRAPISAFYPRFELACIAVALWAALVVPGWPVWPTSLLGWLLLTLAAIDRAHFILPDMLTLPLLGLGLAVAAVLAPDRLGDHAIGAAAGFAAFALIAAAYRRVRGREGLGLGDAKLLAAGGAWLGWQALPTVVAGAAGLALAVALAARALAALGGASAPPLAADQRLAFGPYLCAAIWLVWLYGPLSAAGG